MRPTNIDRNGDVPTEANRSGRQLFDSFSHDYDETLRAGLVYSGETPAHFARERVAWLARCLRSMNERPKRLLDYGCGKASGAPVFYEVLGIETLVGIDLSAEMVQIARDTQGSTRTRFGLRAETRLREEADLVYCNGVFHHISPNERAGELAYVFESLKPGGIFAFWENNPWNPATRFVMSRVAFDADAEMLSPIHAKDLVRRAGFEVLRVDFLFIFPRLLKWLRFMEPPLSRLPLGTQYQVLCRRPRD